MTESGKPKVVVVVGPTASGKTTLGIEIAKRFDGEIISADSRQVYRGLDIGTGKVTEEEMGGVPHHLLDVADPMETYTAADFVRDGRKAAADILSRKKLPIIVGGSFFYVDALIGKVSAPEVPPNPELRTKLEEMSTDALYTALLKTDERRALDIDPYNKRRIIRALEIVEALGKVPAEKTEPVYSTLTIGIDIPRDVLHKNIHERLYARVDAGMIEEAKGLLKQGDTLFQYQGDTLTLEQGVSYERMEELGLEYRYIARYLKGEMDKETMFRELEIKTRQFAKRQMTWLKRDKTIHWFGVDEHKQIFNTISDFIGPHQAP